MASRDPGGLGFTIVEAANKLLAELSTVNPPQRQGQLRTFAEGVLCLAQAEEIRRATKPGLARIRAPSL